MSAQQIIMLGVQTSVLLTVFGFGLEATTADLLHLVRRPRKLARSLLAMFVIVPAIAVALASMFALRPAVEIALVALALSPVPPLLPRREMKSGGSSSYAIGLLATAALLSIVVIPVALHVLSPLFREPVAIPFRTVALLALKTVLLPLVAGMALHARAPHAAARMVKPVAVVGGLLLLASAGLIVGHSLSAIGELIGDGTLLGLVVFVVLCNAVGHLLGGPEPEDRIVLALSSASRHPAIAFAIASASHRDVKLVPAAILLYLILSAVVSMPYAAWQQRRLQKMVA